MAFETILYTDNPKTVVDKINANLSEGFRPSAKNTVYVLTDAEVNTDARIYDDAQDGLDSIPTTGDNKPTSSNKWTLIVDNSVDVSALVWTAHISANTADYINVIQNTGIALSYTGTALPTFDANLYPVRTQFLVVPISGASTLYISNGTDWEQIYPFDNLIIQTYFTFDTGNPIAENDFGYVMNGIDAMRIPSNGTKIRMSGVSGAGIGYASSIATESIPSGSLVGAKCTQIDSGDAYITVLIDGSPIACNIIVPDTTEKLIVLIECFKQ